MRIQQVCTLTVLVGFTVAPLAGCNRSSEIGVKSAPAVVAPPPKPVPADVKKGGGKGSSGNMNRNPGASS
jgi:hypothetical protein